MLIPKWVTTTLFITGVGIHSYKLGFSGAINSLAGALSFAIFVFILCRLPGLINPNAIKRLGGGDYKLALGCGAWVGQENVWILMAIYTYLYALIKIVQYLLSIKRSGGRIIGNLVADLKAEVYGYGTPHREAFAPYLAAPFLLTMYALEFYNWRWF
ncbi:hypothetical protein Dred_0958 [Desulforamulus reducens MI-1]|uniref:Prepilin type IV endopeptidase peptidase domain-containing protein n=2 Tax=Desulforamulus TaxID=2916693 RepID=A4J340_DESRM|nr:hypothetical protein Dred_0958 [Desulforamulus reducens MI-1]